MPIASNPLGLVNSGVLIFGIDYARYVRWILSARPTHRQNNIWCIFCFDLRLIHRETTGIWRLAENHTSEIRVLKDSNEFCNYLGIVTNHIKQGASSIAY